MTLAPYFTPQNQRCLVIAEVAQSHDGNINLAHDFVDAVAKTGADAIKFQTHIAAAESTLAEPFRVKFSTDATRYSYWQRMEFIPQEWQGLADHAKKLGLVFLSSPFSMEACDLLESIGMEAWKVASGEITNTPMLKRMAASKKPVILSSGLATWDELDEAVSIVKHNPHAVLQTTTMYPTPPQHVGFNVLTEMSKRYGCTVGLSDHSGTIFPGLAGYALGARILEVHVALSKDMVGPDVSSSLVPEELTQLVQGLRFLEQATTHPVDKNAAAKNAQELRTIFSKSIVAAKPLKAGVILTAGDLALKKPGGGLPPKALESLYGKQLLRDLNTDDRLSDADFKA